jgi:hypothetical protein
MIQWIKKMLRSPLRRSIDTQTMDRRERITVFFLSLIIAFILWFVVSLGRDHTTEVPFVLKVGQVPDQLALASALPDTVMATVTADGWKLLGLRLNPETIPININESTINVYERIRDILRTRAITIISTQPSVLKVTLERKITKNVPVVIQSEFQFKKPYDTTEAPTALPDSVALTGATSIVNAIAQWPTVVLKKTSISDHIVETVPLTAPPANLSMNVQQVVVRARVAEFTEGEQRTRIQVKGLPKDRIITFNPAIISIRYLIPIEQYSAAQNVTLFSATVSYADIIKDSTGFVSPVIATLNDTLLTKIKLVQPRRVAYYKVIQ